MNSEIEMSTETQASLVSTESQSEVAIAPKPPKKKKRNVFVEDMKKNWRLHLIFIPVVVFFLVFSYFPMVGILTAFMDYKPILGIFGSKWVGFDHFARLFSDEHFGLVFRNTVVMALLNLVVGFVVPVAFALLLAEIRTKWFKRTVEICSYLPNFVAAVVVCNLVINFLGSSGVISNIIAAITHQEAENLLAKPELFWAINTLVVLWQGMGYSAIVYSAAIAGVNQDLHEAAVLDGANRWQRVWHITIPAILPMLVTMLVLRVGLMFTTGFDNILLLYNTDTYPTADVLSTYTYRMGIGSNDFGYATAIGLFQSIIATVLLIATNWLSGKLAKTSLF